MIYFIDMLYEDMVNIEGEWYVAKPVQIRTIRERFRDAYRVFTGKATAVYFKEDMKPDGSYET